jgi:hypothetical protein
MQELLQQIDTDYYRSARLLLVHAELEQLRQESLEITDLKRQREIPQADKACSEPRAAMSATIACLY